MTNQERLILVGCEHVYISSVSPGHGEWSSENWDVCQKVSEVYIMWRDLRNSRFILNRLIHLTKYWSNTSFVPGSVPGGEDTVVIKTNLERAVR